MDQRRLQRQLRCAAWLAAGVGLAYLVWRYDLQTLPEDRCSPLLRFDAGDQIVLDRSPRGPVAGDAYVFRGPDGLPYLGVVRDVRDDGALWIVADDPDCPGRDSDDFGWIEQDLVDARVLFAWPW